MSLLNLVVMEYGLRHGKESAMLNGDGVLILVVMEYGLRRISLAECSDYEVLILVVMEYGLRLSMYVVMPVGIVES